MAQLAIQGHATRGKEVIKLLEMLGGINKIGYFGDTLDYYYFIADEIKNVAATAMIAYNSGKAAKIKVLPNTS